MPPKKQLPSHQPDDDLDKRCATEDCGAFHIKGSPYCNVHSGNLAALNDRRKVQTAKAQELQDEFDFQYFSTRTRADVQVLTEKVINGVLRGILRKDKGAMLSVFLPMAYKIAKELEGTTTGSRGGVSVKISENKSLTLHMDESMMDRYLNANEQVRVQMLEDMQGAGQIELAKSGDVIDVVSTVTPENVKIPAAALAEITAKTDVPLTTKQVTKLFGKTLANSLEKSNEPPGADMTGFGHLFMPNSLPEGSDLINHKWKGAYEVTEVAGMKAGKLYFTCEYCGRKEPNVIKEPCKTANQTQK